MPVRCQVLSYVKCKCKCIVVHYNRPSLLWYGWTCCLACSIAYPYSWCKMFGSRLNQTSNRSRFPHDCLGSWCIRSIFGSSWLQLLFVALNFFFIMIVTQSSSQTDSNYLAIWPRILVNGSILHCDNHSSVRQCSMPARNDIFFLFSVNWTKWESGVEAQKYR